MSELFGWLENADDNLLIRSCVFHYEFEFIHPFADMKAKGIIRRIGANRNGYWEIVDD